MTPSRAFGNRCRVDCGGSCTCFGWSDSLRGFAFRHWIVVLQPVLRHRLLLGCLEGRTVVPLRPQFARTGSCVIRHFRPLLFFLCRKRYRDEWVGCSVGALQVRLIQTEWSTCSSRVCRVVGSASVDPQTYASHRGSCQRGISQTLVGRETTNERT
jgi:hypothetical protein